MAVRIAEQADIKKILSITSACAKDMVSKGIFQWNDQYPNQEAFENDLKNNWLYVITNNQNTVGSISITPEMDEEYNSIKWLTSNNKNLYIHRLAVHPEMQRKGYAQKLMNFAEGYAKKNNYISIRLDTFSKNFRNQRFYEQRGYQRLENVYFPQQSQDPFYCYELII
tara:strand:+ start:4186 stop:4689 length:504 start_codon:yes stop_codon:yes gene_type:complete